MTQHDYSASPEPAIGLIGGSGLYEMEELQLETEHALQTPYGTPSGLIVEGKLSGRRVCFLARRIVQAAVPLIGTSPDLPEHRALDTAILTPPSLWPEERKKQLLPILSRFA